MTKEEAYQRLNISEIFIPASSPNRPGTKTSKTAVTIHNTDNPSPKADALAHARYLSSSDARNRKVSWHFTVDDKRTVKHLPTGEVGWHTGTEEGNQTSIGIEICMNEGCDQKAANNRAALLAALLMNELGIEKLMRHKDWSGKNCPSQILKQTGGWTDFCDQVKSFRSQLSAE